MEVKAIAKSVRISAKKARPLAKVLRGKKSNQALDLLRFDVSKTSNLLYKLIFSAVSNAKNNYNLKEDNLRIKTLTIDVGPSFKRYWFRSRGSADRLIKRSSHMAVVLEEIKPTLVKRPVAVQPSAATSTVNRVDKSTPAGPKGMSNRNEKMTRQANVKKVITTRTTNK